MDKTKKNLLQIVLCIGLIVLIWMVYFITMEILNRNLEPCENDFSWMYQVDSAEIEEKRFILRGFAFCLGQNTTGSDYKIVLQELESEKNYFLKMKYTERADVNNYFSNEFDYLRSGFEAYIDVEKIDLQEKNYEILLRMENSKKAYRTGIYLADGELAYVNPMKFVPLEVEGTDLEEIVERGISRVYRPEDDIYIYQYGGELYWIAGPNYSFESDGDVYIQYRLDTTQVNKLPKEQLMNQIYWDDRGFMFCKNELSDWNTGKYRVAKEKLPTEYPIEKIWSGRYKGDWLWLQYFRPYYQFEK